MRKHLLYLMLISVPVSLPLYAGAAQPSGAQQDTSALQQQNDVQSPSLPQNDFALRGMSKGKRFTFLRDFAIDWEKQVLGGFNVDTKKVIQAYEALHKAFPGRFNQAALLWKTAWLNWQGRNLDAADAAAQKLLTNYASSPEAVKAALLHVRVLIKRGRLVPARNLLIRYFGLKKGINSHHQHLGLVWLSVIDESEGNRKRKQQAYRAMQRIIRQDASAVTGNAVTYAAYIRLLDRFSTRKSVLLHTEDFVRRYISTPEAPAIRLLLADTLLGIGQVEKAKTIYAILADRYPHRDSGVKASMRRMMIDVKRHPDRLNNTLTQLSNIASNNQLSNLEAEAWLDQARLLTGMGKYRTEKKDRPFIPERALENYALVTASDYPAFASRAQVEGRMVLRKTVRHLLQQQAWLQAVVLWRRFPQLRPANDEKLMLDIAHAYMQLMDFSHAETLLDKMYLQSMGSIRGQRMMLEKARLWAERGDADAASKILQWLSRHEQSLYRPGMLLIAANVQSKMGKASEAKQTLAGINPVDLMPALNHTYWLTRAKINEQLRHWHAAAKAWRHLVKNSSGSDKWRVLYGEARALIRGMDYQAALDILPHIPLAARNATWHFYVGLSAYRTGQRKRAKKELNLLRNEGEKSPAYSLLARYMLDAHKIDDLGEALP